MAPRGAVTQVRHLALVPKGFTTIADLSSAVGLGTIPDGARRALISVETQAVRWRDDGEDPTDSVGHLLPPGGFMYEGDLAAIKLIEAAASAAVFVSFYN